MIERQRNLLGMFLNTLQRRSNYLMELPSPHHIRTFLGDGWEIKESDRERYTYQGEGGEIHITVAKDKFELRVVEIQVSTNHFHLSQLDELKIIDRTPEWYGTGFLYARSKTTEISFYPQSFFVLLTNTRGRYSLRDKGVHSQPDEGLHAGVDLSYLKKSK